MAADKQVSSGRPSGRPVVAEKQCTKCKRTKRYSDDPTLTEFDVKTRNPDRTPRTWQSWCKVCMRRDARRRQGVKRTGKPYKKRRKRLTPEQVKERARARHAQRMQEDPEYVRNKREADRMRKAEQRRAAGIPQRSTYKASDAYMENARDFVPSGPFIEWLKGVKMMPAQIANAAKVDSKRIYVYYGPDAPDNVSIGFVDRIMHAVRAAENINDLYPLDA